MPTKLGRLVVVKKQGTERFHDAGRDIGFDLHSFWQWAVSDLVSNATRGVLAEYLVARALGVGVDDIRAEWDPFDLTTPSDIKVEVKSAAFVQTWHQNRHSSISFRCPKTLWWDPETNSQSKEANRHADVYVFALLSYKYQDTIDPMDVGHWEFFVVPTRALNDRKRSQSSITLSSIKKEFGNSVPYFELERAVTEAYIKS